MISLLPSEHSVKNHSAADPHVRYPLCPHPLHCTTRRPVRPPDVLLLLLYLRRLILLNKLGWIAGRHSHNNKRRNEGGRVIGSNELLKILRTYSVVAHKMSSTSLSGTSILSGIRLNRSSAIRKDAVLS
jgi:hypothetical protein